MGNLFEMKGPESAEFVLMDFTTEGKGISGGQLMSRDWLATQTAGLQAHVVQPKTGENPSSQISLAVGAGRGGSNALLVEDPRTDGSELFPEFWVIMYEATGGSWANPVNGEQYALSTADPNRGVNESPQTGYNRIRFWMKFQDGLYDSWVSNINNTQSMHWGTYHMDSSRLPWDGHEYDGIFDQHGYTQFMVRHDLADDTWIEVISSPWLQHQRAHGGELPPWEMTRHYTGPGGHGMMDTLTRIYIASANIGLTPEISGPIQYWVDSISFYREPESPTNPITVDCTSHDDFSQVQYVADGVSKVTMTFDLANTSGSPFTARVCMAGVNFNFDPVFKKAGSAFTIGDEVVFSAFETIQFSIEVVARVALASSTLENYCGVSVIPSVEYENTGSYKSRGLSDNRVEIRGTQDQWHGAPDCHGSGSYVILVKAP